MNVWRCFAIAVFLRDETAQNVALITNLSCERSLMPEVTTLLSAAVDGDPTAASRLLPLVYDELRRLAGIKMAHENPGQTLTATALVHEAYLRLVGTDGGADWDSRGHFFVASAEAMRRILVENARRKNRQKHGGGWKRVDDDHFEVSLISDPAEVPTVHDSLEHLAREDNLGSEIVKLRYFAGLSVDDASRVLGISRAAAYRHWKFARAWLLCELDGKPAQKTESDHASEASDGTLGGSP